MIFQETTISGYHISVKVSSHQLSEELEGNIKKCKRNLKDSMELSKKYKDFRYNFSRNYHIYVTTSAWQFLPTDSQGKLEGNTKKCERNLKDSLINLHKNKDFSRNCHIQVITSAWKFPLIDSQEELERNTRKCKRNLKENLIKLSKSIKRFEERFFKKLPYPGYHISMKVYSHRLSRGTWRKYQEMWKELERQPDGTSQK